MRSTRVLLAALAAGSFVVAACGSGAASQAPVATNLPAPTVNPDAAKLTDGTWNLVEFSPDPSIKVGGDLNPTINFSTDGKVSGVAACNNYTSTYTVDGDALTIGPAASTMMACATDIQSKFETAYLAALAKVRTYFIELKGETNTLTLADEAGKPLARYTLASTSLAGDWLATGYNNGKQALVSLAAGSEITMTLTEAGDVTGNATCNTYNGTYKVDGDKITFGPLMSTKMACASNELNTQEQAYLAALGNTTTWELANGVLTFRDDAGAMQATYTAK
jgi:heat shock protein HslJ